MHTALRQQAEHSSIYIDDVLIYSFSWEEQLVHIRGVLDALREAGLTAKPNKCVWGARSLEYLGHEIGDGLVSVPEARLKALRYFHRPTNQKGLWAFLGTAGYYRRFIPEFAKWVGPLFPALKKGIPYFIQWDKYRTNAFNYLANVLCDEHTLTLPRSEDQLVLHTDASMLGV